jgi:ABC-type transporter MlaC component
MRKYTVICASILILLCLPYHAYADQPIEVIQQCIDRGIQILRDPRYQDKSQRKLQRKKLSETLGQALDYEEFSKRVLAKNLRSFSSNQLEEFIDLFTRFINLYYIPRLQDRYDNETVAVLGQDFISPTKAIVRIKVFWKNRQVPVEIKMIRRSQTWKVYDLSALGIGAVSFYRAQFRAILKRRTPSQVIEMMREKVKLQKMKNQNDG